MGIIEAFINFIIGTSFEVGLFISEILTITKKGQLKKEMSSFKQLMISTIGALIIGLITLLIFVLIIKGIFKYLF